MARKFNWFKKVEPLIIEDSVWGPNRTKWSKKCDLRNSSHANENRAKTGKNTTVVKMKPGEAVVLQKLISAAQLVPTQSPHGESTN